MSNIICARCGEPWDSTGGLNWTHSDLSHEEYVNLVTGQGCPCCEANFADNEEYTEKQIAQNIEDWQKSVERLSEGDPDFMYHTFNQRPWCEKRPLY